MKDQELNTEHSIAVSKRNLKASIIDAFFPNEMHNQNIMSELTSGMPSTLPNNKVCCKTKNLKQ